MAFWKINENDASPSKQGIMQQEDPEDQHKKDAENSDDSDSAKSQGFEFKLNTLLQLQKYHYLPQYYRLLLRLPCY